MATFGWVREDGMDAFFEGTDRVPDPGPAPEPTFSCPFCKVVVGDRRALQDHVSDRHRVERPIILLRGSEPSQQKVIRFPLRKAEIVTANVMSALVGIDGMPFQTIAWSRLAEQVSGLRQAEVSLILFNNSQVNSAPVTTSYKLSIRIAETRELKEVERAFDEVIMSAPISRASIGRFLADPRSKGAGSEYAAGLADYSLGVLIKERPEAEMLTTPFARYRELYGSAVQRLTDFDRPLARLVGDVIRFAMNDFSRTTTETGFWELDIANGLLKDPSQDIGSPFDEDAVRRPVCPIDHATSRILNLAGRMSNQIRWSPILDGECREIASSELLDASDRQKALAIWAVAAWRLNAKQSSIEPLRQISATYPFSTWAEPYLESATQ